MDNVEKLKYIRDAVNMHPRMESMLNEVIDKLKEEYEQDCNNYIYNEVCEIYLPCWDIYLETK